MNENVEIVNAVGTDPYALKEHVSELINKGYVFMFEMRGWLYFGKYDKV